MESDEFCLKYPLAREAGRFSFTVIRAVQPQDSA